MDVDFFYRGDELVDTKTESSMRERIILKRLAKESVAAPLQFELDAVLQQLEYLREGTFAYLFVTVWLGVRWRVCVRSVLQLRCKRSCNSVRCVAALEYLCEGTFAYV